MITKNNSHHMKFVIFVFVFNFVYCRREVEQRLRELKRRKKEKKIMRLKELEEEREKDKKRWTDFNSKVKSI